MVRVTRLVAALMTSTAFCWSLVTKTVPFGETVTPSGFPSPGINVTSRSWAVL
jgi:hypothetical protein